MCAMKIFYTIIELKGLSQIVKYHELLNIPKEEDEYIYGKNDLFSLVIILKQMLSKEDFKDLMQEIKHEVKKLDDIVSTVPLTGILERIGFPK